MRAVDGQCACARGAFRSRVGRKMAGMSFGASAAPITGCGWLWRSWLQLAFGSDRDRRPFFVLCDSSYSPHSPFLIMFSGGGFGGALKGLGSKAEELLEKKKGEVEQLADQKKQVASSLLEEQAKKTGDLLWQTKSDIEKTAVGTAKDGTKAAIDAFDAEVGKAEKAVDGAINTASETVDQKLKEADQFVDKKRDEAHAAIKTAADKAHDTTDTASGSLLGKAKGILPF